MNPTKNNILTLLFCATVSLTQAQNLDSLLQQADSNETVYTMSTFKGTRLIHGHSIEAPGKGVWQLMFSHRFGTLEDPVYTFLGMSQASIRFGLDYGITDGLAAGIGRSSGLGGSLPPPTYDFYVKQKLVRQSSGLKNIPISVSVMAMAAIDTEKWPTGLIRTNHDRFSYGAQVLVARKFNESFSLQLMPTILQRNLVEAPDQENLLMAIGIGGRIKLSKRMALTAEYYANKPNSLGAGFYNPIALGLDVETGGHVFQIMLTNSTGLVEPQFLGRTATNFFDGPKGMRLGFNFSRVFGAKKKTEK